jgi:hypothetical protein
VAEAPGASLVVKSRGSWFCAAAGTASAADKIIVAIGRKILDLVIFFICAPY